MRDWTETLSRWPSFLHPSFIGEIEGDVKEPILLIEKSCGSFRLVGVVNLSHIIYIMGHVGYNKLIEGKVAAVSGAFVWLKCELTVIMFTYNLKRARIFSSHPRNFISFRFIS